MAREAIYHKAKLLRDGSLYTIGDRKYQNERDEWQILETFNSAISQRQAVDETPEEIQKKIEEFMDSDLDLGQVKESQDPNDIDYHSLRDFLKAKGFDIKGNPKKDTLIEMYKEAMV